MKARSLTVVFGFAVGCLAQATCSTTSPPVLTSSECTEACAFADLCGFLPSALGWDEDGDTFKARLNCEERCAQTWRTDEITVELLKCLNPDIDPLPRKWCGDEESQFYRCGFASQCIEQVQKVDVRNAIGEAEVLFTLLPQDVYDHYFSHEGFLSTFDLLESASPVEETCDPALCSDDQCATVANGDGSVFCDTRLCTVSVFSSEQECERLGVTEVEIGVQRYPFCTCNKTFQCDQTTDDTTNELVDCPCDRDCDPSFTPTATVLGSEHLDEDGADARSLCADVVDIRIPSDVHRIEPGPVIPYIRVRGELSYGDLIDLGINPAGSPGFAPIHRVIAATDTDTDTTTTTGMGSDSDTDPPTTDPTTGGMTTDETTDTMWTDTMATETGYMTETGGETDGEDPNMRFTYCWQFRGPSLLIRAGNNRVVVPFPSFKYLDDIEDGEQTDFTPTPCLQLAP